MHISLDPPSFIGENLPGCSAQTRDYYLDSSSRRKRSLDRSSSIRKTAAAVVAEIDELKGASTNAKVLPTNADYIHGAKGLTCDLYPNSLRDDLSETFESKKKSKKWGWKIWGFLNKTSSKDEEDDIYRKCSSVNGVERSWSQSWPELRREGNGGLSRNMMRSNSSVSWRHEGPFANGRRSSVDAYGNSGRRSDFGIDKRSNSGRYSPSHLDNGLLRFYLMPMRASGRRGRVK